MYSPHSIFVQPDDENVKVWKYMDFTKLISLLDSRCLFFTRADLFNDPFEGSWPCINVAARRDPPPDSSEAGRERWPRMMAAISDISMRTLKHNAVNCWHMNEHESAAMWKLYLKSDAGVAVQSTYRKLRSSITDDQPVYLGVVKYIDYETEWVDARNLFSTLVHKRKSFEHEREVRAVVTKHPTALTKNQDGNMVPDFDQETIDRGIRINIDVNQLVERIYVVPSSPTWFADTVKSVIQRYGYEFPVVHSKLSEQPVF